MQERFRARPLYMFTDLRTRSTFGVERLLDTETELLELRKKFNYRR